MAGTIPNSTGKIQVRRLSHTYLDAADDTRKPFLADDAMIITSSNLNGMMLYAPVETKKGLLMAQTHVDEFWENDPPVCVERFESNPMPFMKRPDGVIEFTVS